MTRAALVLRIVDGTARRVGWCITSQEAEGGEDVFAALLFAVAWTRWLRVPHARTIWS